MTVKIGGYGMSVFTDKSTGRGVISCDWFTLSCKLLKEFTDVTLPVPDGLHCLACAPTSVWGRRFYIMDNDGNKVATFLCCPRTPKIPSASCNIQIANRWLYYDDFRSVCNTICDIVPLSIAGLNRVDLCCDFEMTEELFGTYMALAKKDAKVKGLQESVCWWKTLKTSNADERKIIEEVPNQLNWGGKDSTFKWKVYYKWLELATAPPEEKKPWIIDTWRFNNFSEQHVWRIEVSISNPNSVVNLDGSRIKPFEWHEDRVRLFRDIYTDKFVVRRKDGHANARYNERLPFLELGGTKSVRHALPSTNRDDSDPEKRVVCKLWSELMQGDTKCNHELSGMIRENLMRLLERPSNLWVLQRMYGLTTEEIVERMQC